MESEPRYLITLEEFLTEAGKKPTDPAADTYFFLERLVEEKKLRPGEVLGMHIITGA